MTAPRTWCTEDWRGARLSLEVTEVLCDEHTGLQHLQILQSAAFGRVMLLDGFVMLTERDECAYHEMMAHVPLLGHPCPRDVAIIGGGDGGTLREVLRHPEVERAVLCEIDRGVVDASRRYLPKVCGGSFDDPRAEINIGDGIAWVREAEPASLDVILVDSTDPVGPGTVLFTEAFYASCRRALRPGGLLALQSESPFENAALFTSIQRRVGTAFATVRPYLLFVPTYPSGMWSLSLAGAEAPTAPLDARRAAAIGDGCRYYTPALHSAAFVLPRYASELSGGPGGAGAAPS